MSCNKMHTSEFANPYWTSRLFVQVNGQTLVYNMVLPPAVSYKLGIFLRFCAQPYVAKIPETWEAWGPEYDSDPRLNIESWRMMS